MISKVKNYILELFFPVSCVSCGEEGDWLCKNCESKIKYINSSFCIKCNAITDNYRICEKCRRNSNLKGVFILGYYNDEILKKAIWEFKYNFMKEMGPFLSKIMARHVKNKADFENSIIASVPLDKKRLKWRGFNQSEILAIGAAQNLNVTFLKDTLKRVKETQIQMKLSRPEREKNISGAFAVRRVVQGKKIFLVDDVITTGSTLEECAKELKKAGAKEVWGVVSAKD